MIAKTPELQAPFPYFGGKSRVAPQVWERFGDVPNYVEPFFGSGAVLLGRPEPFGGTETVNDADGLLANFWRGVQFAPDEVAHWADWPVNENDLHARHAWLFARRESMQSRLEGDPLWFDAQAAGWWCWGACCSIASGWCAGNGPWHVEEIDGEKHLVKGTTDGAGAWRQRPHLGDAGRGMNRRTANLVEWMHALAERLRRVRVCCGDWARITGPAPTTHHGTTAVFLDPPYSAEANRAADCYATDSLTVAHDVREWAIANGDNRDLRIALCGYEGEHAMPDSWECMSWKTKGGYGSQSNARGRENQTRERIWFSPHCLKPQHKREPLFAWITD